MMKCSRSRFVVCLCLLVYFLSIYMVYNIVRATFPNVEGYGIGEINTYIYISNSLVLFISTLFIKVKDEAPSVFFLWLIFYLLLAPSTLFFQSVIGADLFETSFYTATNTFFFTVIVCLSRIRIKKAPSVRVNGLFLNIALLLFFTFSVVMLVRQFGLNLSGPSIFDVYGVRSEYKASAGLVIGYLTIISGFFLSPLLFILGVVFLKRKKITTSIFYMGLSLFSSWLIYSTTGFKSVAFMVFAVLFAYVILKKCSALGFGICANYIIVAAIVLAFLCYCAGFDDPLIHWIRRTMVVPAMNSAYYYQYSSTHGGFSGYAPSIISNLFYGTDGSANSGFIGDSIVRFGTGFYFIGFFVVLFIIKLPDLLVNNNNAAVAALFFPSVYALSNSSMTTVFITYGYVFMVLFVYLLGGRLSAKCQVQG